MSVYDEIQKEREYQDHKWGGPSHDDLHKATRWLEMIHKHVGDTAFRLGCHAYDEEDVRARLVKAAAFCVAAVESLDRTRPCEPTL